MIAQARQDHPELSVRRLWALLGLARRWYYERPERPTQADRDVALRDAGERLVLEFPGYGYRRVTKALQREGWAVNHKRVLRVMRQESLLCQLKRRFVVTTDSGHALRTDPNLAAGFAPVGPNQLWVADITDVRLPTGFAYLACVLDAWSRRCVGWQLSRTIDTRLTLAALDQAVAGRRPAPGLIHHADRGVQYASADYVARLEAAGAHISMTAVGNPYENAKAESFFTRRSRARRCTCRATRPSRRPRRTSAGSSRTATTPSGCTRAWGTCPRSSSRRGPRERGATRVARGIGRSTLLTSRRRSR
jgi:putative transposase